MLILILGTFSTTFVFMSMLKCQKSMFIGENGKIVMVSGDSDRSHYFATEEVDKGPSRETNLAKSQTLSDSAETPPSPQ